MFWQLLGTRSSAIRSRLVVVESRPGKNLVIGVLLFIGVCLVFFFGREIGISDARIYREKSSELEKVVEKHGLKFDLMEKELASGELLAGIHRATIIDLRNVLAGSKGDHQDLLERLRFYEGVISKSSLRKGVISSDLQLTELDNGNRYEFDLVITQSGESVRNVSMELKLEAIGLMGGSKSSRTIENVSESKEYPIKAKFKYFHRQTGVILLPDNFEPQTMRVWIKTRNGDYVSTDFNWGQKLRLKNRDIQKGAPQIFG